MVNNDALNAAVSWSSGKDSSIALQEILKSGKFNIVTLLTTVNADYDRVSMHGVREELLQKQAKACGLPMLKVEIPKNSTNQIYDEAMKRAIETLKSLNVQYMIFGDIFLEDVREYRIRMMKGTGIEPLFPLWGRNTTELAQKIIESGIKAKISCVDPSKVDKTLGGADFDLEFLKSLPDDVDPCGENGEFHTFVYDAPFFNEPVNVRKGESVFREGFYFTDLVPE